MVSLSKLACAFSTQPAAFETRNYFVESGAAAEVLALADYGGVPLAQEQKDLTPLQRMVIVKEAKRQQEAVEKGSQMDSGPSGFQNSAASSGPNTHSISGETVEFVNENA